MTVLLNHDTKLSIVFLLNLPIITCKTTTSNAVLPKVGVESIQILFIWMLMRGMKKNWRHDNYEHVYQRGQLSFVAEGYQYIYIESRIYLVPQNHLIWIPSNIKHKSHSEAKNIDLVVVLY